MLSRLFLIAPAYAFAADPVWVDLSGPIVSTRGTPNFSPVVFVGQEGWVGGFG